MDGLPSNIHQLKTLCTHIIVTVVAKEQQWLLEKILKNALLLC